jgi:hypothetical protein
MKLKPMLESIEGLPDALKDLYEKGADGKYHLALDGEPSGFVPKNKLDEFRTNNIALQKQVQDLESKFQGIDLEEFHRLQEEQRKLKDKQLIDAGKIDELVAQRTESMRNDYEAKVKKISEALDTTSSKAQTYEQRLASLLVNTQVTKHIDSVGRLRKGALDDVMNRAARVWKYTEGEIKAFEGESPIYGKDGKNALTMDEWVSGLAETAPYLFEESSGSGSRGNNSSRQNEGAKVISKADPAAFSANLADVAAGKVVVR